MRMLTRLPLARSADMHTKSCMCVRGIHTFRARDTDTSEKLAKKWDNRESGGKSQTPACSRWNAVLLEGSGPSSPLYVWCERAPKTPCRLAVLTGVRTVFFSAALASLPTAMRARLPMFCGTSLIALRTLSDGIAA